MADHHRGGGGGVHHQHSHSHSHHGHHSLDRGHSGSHAFALTAIDELLDEHHAGHAAGSGSGRRKYAEMMSSSSSADVHLSSSPSSSPGHGSDPDKIASLLIAAEGGPASHSGAPRDPLFASLGELLSAPSARLEASEMSLGGPFADADHSHQVKRPRLTNSHAHARPRSPEPLHADRLFAESVLQSLGPASSSPIISAAAPRSDLFAHSSSSSSSTAANSRTLATFPPPPPLPAPRPSQPQLPPILPHAQSWASPFMLEPPLAASGTHFANTDGSPASTVPSAADASSGEVAASASTSAPSPTTSPSPDALSASAAARALAAVQGGIGAVGVAVSPAALTMPGIVNISGRRVKERVCKIPGCDQVAKSDHERFEHMQRAHQIFACVSCDLECATEVEWQAHLPLHRGDRPYMCNFCGRGFDKAHTLSRHASTHGGERRHECDECGARFTRSSALAVHKKTHAGVEGKRFVCDHPGCEKAFTQNSTLTVHKRTHTGEKPFKCEICNKAYAQRSALVTHQRTHTGDKPYGCQFCDMRFSTSSNLIQHQRTHAGGDVHACTLCSKRFTRRAGLIAHQAWHAQPLVPLDEVESTLRARGALAPVSPSQLGVPLPRSLANAALPLKAQAQLQMDALALRPPARQQAQAQAQAQQQHHDMHTSNTVSASHEVEDLFERGDSNLDSPLPLRHRVGLAALASARASSYAASPLLAPSGSPSALSHSLNGSPALASRAYSGSPSALPSRAFSQAFDLLCGSGDEDEHESMQQRMRDEPHMRHREDQHETDEDT